MKRATRALAPCLFFAFFLGLGSSGCACDGRRIGNQADRTGCGNGVLERGEECDGSDFGGLHCIDFGGSSGMLTCNDDCTINLSTCDCYPCTYCADGRIDYPEVCEPGNLAGQTCQTMGCTGGTLACSPDCLSFDLSGCTGCIACGNGVKEGDEECDCGADPSSLPVDCTDVNGGAEANCSIDCLDLSCQGQALYDDCDPADPQSCCPDEWGNDAHCENTAFSFYLCVLSCATTGDCYYNDLCMSSQGAGYCYPAFCGTGSSAVIQTPVNAACQVPGGGQGYCLPIDLAGHELGICLENGTRQPGQTCDEYAIGNTSQVRDMTWQRCENGVCDLGTCTAVCDPVDVYENDANSAYCPAGTNCLSFSSINPEDPDPNRAGYRAADMGMCIATEEADPSNGFNTCDLIDGWLIQDRSRTCVDIDPDYECSTILWAEQGESIGTRIGICVDSQGPPVAGLWEACSSTFECPAGSMCVEEDLFTISPSGATRCIPYCDTSSAASCSTQHPELPAGNTCTSVSFLFVDDDASPSRLGLCACTPSGC